MDDSYVYAPGQDPMNGLLYSTVDPQKIMDQCFREFSAAEKAHMMSKVPIMIDRLNEKGRITDEFMTTHSR